ncbi:MAG: superoxide dismutase family protein [Actinomycetota bacterium]|nr:superoxide dismutase family protein [Actinomycetota bacterium]
MPRLLIALLALALAACGGSQPTAAPTGGAESPAAGADGTGVAVTGPGGEELGTVTVSGDDAGTVVQVSLQGLEPGFHGFHVHETGTCEGDAPDGAFTTAGGHFNTGDAAHGEHTGDLPPLLVTGDGSVTATVRTDAFTPAELSDADGSAVIVHAGRDNLGNIPDRYTSSDADAPGPDEATTSTGDAGDRAGCGLLAPAGG